MGIKEKIEPLFIKNRNLILYGIIGLFCVGLDYSVFKMGTLVLELPYLISNIFSVLAGIFTSFILNAKYNFKVNDKIAKRMFIFFLIGISGLIVSSMLLYLFIEFLNLNESVSKIFSLVLVVVFQYLFNKLITFKL